MSTIMSANRNNVSTLLNRPLAINKQSKTSSSHFSSSIDNVDTLNAANEFKKLSGQTSIAYNLFNSMAAEGLPDSVRSTGQGWEAEAVKGLLGIIYKDAKPEDQDKFDRVFREFEKVHTHFENDNKVAKELSYLFAKYGKAAFEKHVSDYIQHCRIAWSYHHNVHEASVTDDDIFTPSAMACMEVIDKQIKELTESGQTWTSLICSGTYFKDSCAALSKTLRFHDYVAKSPLAGPTLPDNLQSGTPDLSGSDMPRSKTTEIFPPAGSGQAPVIINNTAYGGNGNSTVTGQSGEPHAASLMDYGIALLNTSAEQLTPEQRTQLSKQFMDLLWGRIQNGGQDKFSEYIMNVEPLQAYTHKLEPIVAMQAGESFISLPEPQFATEHTAISKPSMMDGHSQRETVNLLSERVRIDSPARADDTSVLNKIQYNQRINTVDGFFSTPDILNDGGKTLHNAAKDVARALSDLIDTDGLLTKNNALSSVQREQVNFDNQSIQVPVSSRGKVQALVKKFEQLNAQQGENIQHFSSGKYSETTRRFSETKISVPASTSDEGVQLRRKVSSKIKTVAQQKPLYTTNRTIDPFSRHSAQIQEKVNLSESTKDIDELQIVDNLVTGV